MAELFANFGDPDQMPRSAASDLGLHCLPITLLRVSRLQWVKTSFCQSQMGFSCYSTLLQVRGGIGVIFFLFLFENICLGYSLEVPWGGTSNEYHNIYFYGEIRQISVLFG